MKVIFTRDLFASILSVAVVGLVAARRFPLLHSRKPATAPRWSAS